MEIRKNRRFSTRSGIKIPKHDGEATQDFSKNQNDRSQIELFGKANNLKRTFILANDKGLAIANANFFYAPGVAWNIKITA